MNRLNALCRLEESYSFENAKRGRPFVQFTMYHKIRDAIRYNAKESAFYGSLEKTRQDVENYIIAFTKNYYPSLTDWKISVGKPLEEKKRVKE